MFLKLYLTSSFIVVYSLNDVLFSDDILYLIDIDHVKKIIKMVLISCVMDINACIGRTRLDDKYRLVWVGC